jgi:hypothetical protein
LGQHLAHSGHGAHTVFSPSQRTLGLQKKPLHLVLILEPILALTLMLPPPAW